MDDRADVLAARKARAEAGARAAHAAAARSVYDATAGQHRRSPQEVESVRTLDELGIAWNPGDLGTQQLEQVAIDALADLWRDTYRASLPDTARLRHFRRTVETILYCVTGMELTIER